MILLTGLLALAALTATTLAEPKFLPAHGGISELRPDHMENSFKPMPVYPLDEETAIDNVDPNHIESLVWHITPIERVKAIQRRWPENFLYYEGNEELFDTTFAPHAVILVDGKVYGIGVKDFSKKFKKSYKDAISKNVDRKYELKADGTVLESFKYYFINKGTSTPFIGESYWKEIDGQYKVVLTSYKKVDHLL